RTAVRTKDEWAGDLLCRRKSGEIYPIESRVFAIRNAKGDLVEIAAIQQDISDRKQAEQALRKSEEKHRTLIETLTDIVFTLDKEGKFTYLSPRIEEVTGFPGQDFIGHPFTEIIAPEYIDSTVDRFRRGLAGEKIPLYEIELLRKDGKKVPIELNVSSLLDAEGQVIGRIGTARDITERKQAQETLRLFSRAVDSSVDGIAMGNLENRIAYANDAFVRMFGYSREELMGKKIHSLYSKDQMLKLKDALKTTLEGGWTGELVARRKNGEFFPILISSSRVLDDEGKTVAQMASHLDITERKQAEETLRESEEKFRDIAENVSDMIFRTDTNGRVTYMSPAVEDIAGYRPEECVGKLFHVFVKKRDIPRAIVSFSGTLKGKKVRALQLDMLRKDKTVFPAELSETPITKNGKIIGTQGIIGDISGRVRSTAQLEKSEEKYRKIVELAPDGIITLDREGVVKSCNTAFLKRFGISEDDILDLHFFKSPRVPEKDRARYHKMFNSIMSGKAPKPFEIEWKDKNGNTRFVEIHVNLIKKGRTKTGLQAIVRDITERKRAEAVQRTLHRIADAVHTTEDLPGLYKVIHGELGLILKIKNLAIALYDRERDMLLVEYHVDKKDRFEGVVPAGKTLTAYVIKNDKPLLVTHRKIKQMVRAGQVKPIGAPTKIWLGVPLKARNKTIGALVINDYTDENAYDEKDLALLQLVSGQIALTIERKRAEEEL
ncbi:PAS domain S-box protein, partial [bacterium]|nr:PAS domain S-box protein [bacterium]